MKHHLFSAIALLVLMTALTSSSTACGDDCTVSDTSRSCEWDADRVRSCADISKGIYGTASYTCLDHCPNGEIYTGCYGGIVTTKDSAGHTTTIPFANGFYAWELLPGTYEVCGSVQGTTPICTSVSFTKSVRVDITSIASPGGIRPTLVVNGKAAE